MKLKSFFALLFILASSNIFSQDFQINTNKLVDQTQLSSEDPDKMKLTWWIPIDFWEAVFDEDPTITKEERDETLRILSPYTIIGVVDGDISMFGTVKYKSVDLIRGNTVIIYNNGKTYTPLSDDEIDQDALMLLQIMKPMLANMLGNLGENFHFFVFDNLNNEGDKMVNPKSSGTFSVKVTDELFTYKLPIGALLPQKKCSEDDELLSGAWKYCPWHGNLLE